jgi:hypothetical protein
MDQVEIQVLQAKVVKSTLACGRDVFSTVIRVPELGGDPKILARADPLCDGPPDGCADLFLIAVIASAIEVAISELDRLIYCGLGLPSV